MPKVLIMVAHRPRRSPSQRYRFEQYLPYLESHGFEFTWSYLLDENDDKLFYGKGNLFKKAGILWKGYLKRLKDVKRFAQFDCLFIQREAFFLGTSLFEKKASQSGKKVIFDFDDAIWLPDTSPGNKKWEWLKKPGKFYVNAALADIVIAGNSYLAAEANKVNKNVTIIPTTIDTSKHMPAPKKNGSEIIIGWMGSLSTIKHFEELVLVLVKIKEKFSHVKFKVIGDPSYVNRQLEINGIAWNEESEVREINSFDIGIMPLPDNEWTRGKCGLKALSYMSCEVPVVASSTGVNREIIQHNQNGLLANSEEEWFVCLQELIKEKTLREKLGKAGRVTVEEKYSVTANKEKYLRVFAC